MFRLICTPRALVVGSRRVLNYTGPAKKSLSVMASPEHTDPQTNKQLPQAAPAVNPSQTLKKMEEGRPLDTPDTEKRAVSLAPGQGLKVEPAVAEVNPYKSVTEHRVSISKTLYRRPLPEACIAFASEEGKNIFMEALMSGHMNCYFRLASQFRTQDDPAYCGLATLIMVLNALEIDPGRVWKGPWKWYHEDMLDCCVPVELVKKQGITFDEFICIADCNSIDTRAVRVDKNASLEDFRNLVMRMTKKEDRFLIVSYSRGMMNQTGDGHFAPISGYHPGRDLVLILDTARFKYPPHWVSLPQLFEAMKALDSATGLPRGYVEMWPAKDSKALLLFKIAREYSVNADPDIVESFQRFLSEWTFFLNQPLLISSEEGEHGNEAVLEDVLTTVIRGLVQVAGSLDKGTYVLHTQEHISCANVCNVQCAVEELLSSLESTSIFKVINSIVAQLPEAEVMKLQNLFGSWPSVCPPTEKLGKGDGPSCGPEKRKAVMSSMACCDLNQNLCLCHFIATFLLSWPYSMSVVPDPAPSSMPSSLRSTLVLHVRQDLCSAKSQFLRDEILTLQRQLRKLTRFHSGSSGDSESACCKNVENCNSKQRPKKIL